MFVDPKKAKKQNEKVLPPARDTSESELFLAPVCRAMQNGDSCIKYSLCPMHFIALPWGIDKINTQGPVGHRLSHCGTLQQCEPPEMIP